MLRFLSGAVSFVLKLYMLVLLVAVTVAGVVVYRFLTIDPPSPAEVIEVLSTASAWRVAEAVPRPEAPQRVALLAAGAGREENALGRELGRALREAGQYQPIDAKTLRTVWETIRPRREDVSEPTREELARLAAATGAEAIVTTRIEQARADENPELRVAWKMVGAGEGTPTLAQGVIVETPETAEDAPRFERSPRVTPFTTGWSLLIWLGWTLLVPLGAAGLFHTVLERESNAINGLLLTVLTGLNVLLALLLMGWQVEGWLDGLFVVAASLVAGGWNYFVLERIESLRL